MTLYISRRNPSIASSLLMVILIGFHQQSHGQSVTDSVGPKHRGGKFKNTIRHLYNKLDSAKATHKYIKQINDIYGDIVHKYKKIDSIARTDSGNVGWVYHAVMPAKKVKTNTNATAAKPALHSRAE